MSDSLTVFGTDYTGVTGIKAKGTGNGTLTYIRPSGTKNIGANGTGIDVTEYASVDVAVSDSTFVVTVSYNSTSEMWEPDCTWAEASAAYSAGKTFAINAAYTSGFVTADGNWNADDSALIYFVHQSITISGTDTIHERFYSLGQSELTEFDALDYIIPYGTTSITTNGTHDVTNYASASVNVPTGTARTSADLTVSGATVTAPAGVYASDASKSVASMTLPTAASATSSGTSKATITPGSSAQYINIPAGYNGTASYYTISATSGSSKNVQVAQSTSRATSSTYTSVCSLTCSTAGTYDVYWNCFRSSTGGTSGSQLYVGGSAYGSANTTFTNHIQTNHLTGVSLTKNQTVAVYARSRGSNYYAYCGQLTIVQTA